MAFRSFDPATMTDVERYRFLVNIVVPRPIALVSSVSASGAPNLAPFSFYQAGGSNPPSVVISPTLTAEGGAKDTLLNVSETQEFVICSVTRDMAEQMNRTSVRVPAGESEWGLTCFTQLGSDIVRPARVAESPAQMECKLFTIIRHGDGPSAANYMIGEVVRFHIDDSFLSDELPRSDALAALGRMGGDLYVDTAKSELFRLARPSVRPERP
jgi:flavin reductase (DIM6/NTAB) family NADH-FMN oxidoreductase RutF